MANIVNLYDIKPLCYNCIYKKECGNKITEDEAYIPWCYKCSHKYKDLNRCNNCTGLHDIDTCYFKKEVNYYEYS